MITPADSKYVQVCTIGFIVVLGPTKCSGFSVLLHIYHSQEQRDNSYHKELLLLCYASSRLRNAYLCTVYIAAAAAAVGMHSKAADDSSP